MSRSSLASSARSKALALWPGRPTQVSARHNHRTVSVVIDTVVGRCAAGRTAAGQSPLQRRSRPRLGELGAHRGAGRAGDPLPSRLALEGEQRHELVRGALQGPRLRGLLVAFRAAQLHHDRRPQHPPLRLAHGDPQIRNSRSGNPRMKSLDQVREGHRTLRRVAMRPTGNAKKRN